MGDFAQELEAVAFLLQRVVGACFTDDRHAACLQLEALTLAG